MHAHLAHQLASIGVGDIEHPLPYLIQCAIDGEAEACRKFGIEPPEPVKAPPEMARRLHEIGQDVRRRAGY